VTFDTHGDRKYFSTTMLLAEMQLPRLRVERRALRAGHHEPGVCQTNELAFVISGETVTVQSANGVTYRRFIRPGYSCVCPAGTMEMASGTASSLQCLHIYLPSTLIESSAITDYEIDPAKAELLYTGAFDDPKLYQIAMAFKSTLGRKPEPADRLFLDGMQVALAAYLLENYSVDRWRSPATKPDIQSTRLTRVLDHIEARFADEITLGDLASEAGLSEYHFSRVFRKIMGVSPHRYLTFRRVQEAQKQLERGHALFSEIAACTGFGSTIAFVQVFRKVTGLTPRQYRMLHKQ
jgi:AraC family transcriptional regulator